MGRSPNERSGAARFWDRGHRAQCLEWLLIFAVFALVGGAPAPHVNETHYLTKAKHYWDPTYCPGDLFLDSADPHLVFYWLLGWLTKWCSLATTAWIGRVAAWALLAFGWQRLSWTVTPIRGMAVLSATLWVLLTDSFNFAGEWVVGGVEAKCFAYGLVLLGLAALAAGRWTAPWVWFGAASALHVLVGAWAVAAGLVAWAIERGDRPSLLQMAPGLAAGGLLSLAGVLPGLALERGVDPELANQAAQIYVFERLPHHLAPLELKSSELAVRTTRHAVVVVAFVALIWWNRRPAAKTVASSQHGPSNAAPPDAALARTIRFAAFALMASAAGLAIEVALSNNPAAAAKVLRYYWFRQADVMLPLAVALAGCRLLPTLWQRRTPALRLAAMAPVAWCVWALGATAVERWTAPIPPGAARMDNLAAWRETCQWIDKHTPPDSLFLIPREAQSFKWYAARADAGNRKDVPQDAAGVVAWRLRCQELFPQAMVDGEIETLNSPVKLGTPRVLELARRYGATHVVGRSYPRLDLPRLYKSTAPGRRSYSVYQTGVPVPRAEP